MLESFDQGNPFEQGCELLFTISASMLYLESVICISDLIRDLTRHTEEWQQVTKLSEEHEVRERLLKGRISESEKLHKTLDDKIYENEEIDRERVAGTGLKWFITRISRWKTSQSELDSIRKKMPELDRRGAELELGNLIPTRFSEQNRLTELDGSIGQECAQLGVEITSADYPETNLGAVVDKLRTELEQAIALPDLLHLAGPALVTRFGGTCELCSPRRQNQHYL